MALSSQDVFRPRFVKSPLKHPDVLSTPFTAFHAAEISPIFAETHAKLLPPTGC